MKKIILFMNCMFGILISFGSTIISQENENIPKSKEIYAQAYEYINSMLENDIPLNFKNAVFAVENAFLENNLNYDDFNNEIDVLFSIVYLSENSDQLIYTGKDKDVVAQHAAIFSMISDSIVVILDSTNSFLHVPFAYDFDDPLGQNDWSKMFVSKLLETGKGNCHSLPYLYKILADELKIPCHFAFAPNHLYIKLFSEKTGWYNLELTNGTFPIDAWMMTSGYISTDAIRNGLYMDTLSEKQMLANCLLDLAHGYQHKFGKDSINFVILCCNTLLKYHPVNVNALLTKAEAQKHHIQSLMKAHNVKSPKKLLDNNFVKEMYDEMTSIYTTLHDLGYHQIPKEMYLQWLKTPPAVKKG